MENRTRLLEHVLDAMICGSAAEVDLELAAMADQSCPLVLGLRGVLAFWTGDFIAGTALAGRAVGAATDDHTRVLGLAAAALNAGGDLDAQADPVSDLIGAVAGRDPGDRWWAVMRYFAAEAALVSARLLDAVRLWIDEPAPSAVWQEHRFAVMMWICGIRVAAFSGEIGRAEALFAGPPMDPWDARSATLYASLDALVQGNADNPSAIGSPDRIEAVDQGLGRDFIGRGVNLLRAFGAIAVGRSGDAALLVLGAGGDEGLSRCTIIDRALGLELLTRAAIDDADLVSASIWIEQLAALADNPIAAPTVARARSRLALATGDLDEAERLAIISLNHCRVGGRMVEAAESEIVLARIHIAAGQVARATRELRELVADTDHRGHAAVRRSAADTLRPARRRLPPVTGRGWDALSPREAEVGRLVVEGVEIDQIAERLFLSPHTVRAHVSRVLAAFGAPSRIGLLAAVHAEGSDRSGQSDQSTGLDGLTRRQHDVARAVAHAKSNAEIAEAFGISVKAVEKHIGEIFVRWEVHSRFELARRWWTGQAAGPGPEICPDPGVGTGADRA